MLKIFLNGRWVGLRDAKVPVLDRGFLYGDGVFETMRAYDGVVFKLPEHIKRLFASLRDLRVNVPCGKEALSRTVRKAIAINGLKDAYVKVLVTRGPSSTGIDIPRVQRPTLMVYASRLKRHDSDIYADGVSALVSSITRSSRSFAAMVKSLNYIDNIMAREEARRKGFYESIFVNTEGYVTEAATCNVFIVKNGRILTPPKMAGLLPGITRSVVLEIAGKYFGDKSGEKDIDPDMLFSADEVFLTNSVSELVPVVRIGQGAVGSGRPGPVYKVLYALYRAFVRKCCGGA